MIHFWVRATVDWLDEDAFWAQVTPRFKPYRRSLPGRPSWARDYTHRMADLMDELEPR